MSRKIDYKITLQSIFRELTIINNEKYEDDYKYLLNYPDKIFKTTNLNSKLKEESLQIIDEYFKNGKVNELYKGTNFTKISKIGKETNKKLIQKGVKNIQHLKKLVKNKKIILNETQQKGLKH